jgi:hypothetical protein
MRHDDEAYYNLLPPRVLDGMEYVRDYDTASDDFDGRVCHSRADFYEA